MLRTLFPSTPRPVARGVHIYLGEDGVIVAALHRSEAGIYYEQPAPVVLQGRPDATALGVRFREAFDAFSLKDADLRDGKRSDWPSYQASGLRSMKEFASRYRAIPCFGLNPANAVVRASTAHPTREGIELASSFNPLLAPADLGKALLELAEAARAAA